MGKAKPMSGAAKMKAAGRHAIMLGVSPQEHRMLKEAAKSEGRPVSQFIKFYALRAASFVYVSNARPR